MSHCTRGNENNPHYTTALWLRLAGWGQGFRSKRGPSHQPRIEKA